MPCLLQQEGGGERAMIKVSETLLNKTAQRINFIFTLSWTFEILDDNDKVLWRHRVKFTSKNGKYTTKPATDVCISDGMPSYWILSRGRYRLYGEVGESKELSIPFRFVRGNKYTLNPVTITFNPNR